MSKKSHKILFSSLLLSCSIPAFSTDYITENLSTYMRKGAGEQFKISGTIQAGEKITVLDRKERFVLIRDSRNREGWVLASEVSQTVSPKELIPQLQQQVQDLNGRLAKIDSDWQQRTVEMQRRSHESQKQTSDLLAENTQLKREIEMLKNKNRSLETMQDSEKRAIATQYFIYGGLVLIVGLILGLFIPHLIPRRKSSRWY